MANQFTSAQAGPSKIMQLIAPELAGQQISVGRMQQLASMLQQKALEEQQGLGQTQMVGGWAIPNSPLAGLSSILSGVTGGLLQNKVDSKNADLAQAISERTRNLAFPQEGGQIAGQPDGQGGMVGASMDAGGGQSPEMAQQQPQGQTGDNFNMSNALRAAALGEFSPEAEKAFWAGKAPTQMQRENEYLGVAPEQAKQMQLAKMLKDGTQSFAPGSVYQIPGQQMRAAPDVNNNADLRFDESGNPYVQAIPGAPQIAAERAGAIASATEGAKPTTITTPDGKSIFTTVGGALGQNQGQQAPGGIQPVGAAPLYTEIDQKYGFPPGTMASIEQTESGGNPNALSPKGAQGRFQIMPATQQQPGYGLGKLDPNNPEDAAKYLAAMRDQSGGDLTQAIGKYNAGPAGNLKNPETSNYIKKVTGGIPNYQGGQSSPQGLQVQSPSGEVYAKKDAEQKVDFAGKYESSMSDGLKKSGELMQRLNLTEQALKEFKSGGGTESRAKIAQMAQTLNLPRKVIDGIAGGDLGAMQVVNKTALTESLLQMQHDLSSDTGAAQKSNQMIMEQFMKANPHLDTDPRAWEKLINLQKDIYSGKLSEAKEYWQYKDENQGDTRRFPTYWSEKKSTKVDATKTNNNPFNGEAKSSAKPFSGQMNAQKWATMKSGDTFIDAQGNVRRKP